MIELKVLEKSYGKLRAVQALDLSVKNGSGQCECSNDGGQDKSSSDVENAASKPTDDSDQGEPSHADGDNAENRFFAENAEFFGPDPDEGSREMNNSNDDEEMDTEEASNVAENPGLVYVCGVPKCKAQVLLTPAKRDVYRYECAACGHRGVLPKYDYELWKTGTTGNAGPAPSRGWTI